MFKIFKPSQNSADKFGEFTYGVPNVIRFDTTTKTVIGKFCSIANEVTFILGGNHRTDWVTTYPFPAFSRYFPQALGLVGHPTSKGDLVIGNDVWIGRSAIILSGITIGDGAVCSSWGRCY